MTLARLASCAFVIAVLGCRVGPPPAAPVATGDPMTRFAPRAMISSNHELASAAGADILKAGGNAVDAAVAVGFALAVTYPEAGNIGGGGLMLIRLANGTTSALDYRETAPRRATRDMFVGPDGRPTGGSTIGHLASGVPGSVAGLAEAHSRFGRLPFAQLLQPAIRLAEEGFIVDTALARSLAANQGVIGRFDGRVVFLPGGRPLAAGAVFRQPQLARTLRLIAEQGHHAFYRGEIARMIAAEMRRGGGLVTEEDLADYRPIWREPVRSRYKGFTLLGMPPVSSGGIATAQIFNVLETLDPIPPFGGAAHAHLLAETLKRAFVDRNTLLGDPAFVDIAVDRLVSTQHAQAIAREIRRDRAIPVLPEARLIPEGSHTTHYSVVDAEGNAVSTTTTINDLYGSGVFVLQGGFFLNDEMDDFTARPGVPNQWGLVQGEANAIAPGKRMLSSMSPTIVLDPDGQLLLIIGARGGPRIITSNAQVILNVIEHGMTLAEALSAPRIHHQAWPDTLFYEAGALSQQALDSLAAMGHHPRPAPYSPSGYIGRVHAVMRVGGGWVGAVDPRTSGGAVGY